MPKTKSKKLTWEEKISKQLVGRKIVEVRWMTKEEADENYWDYSSTTGRYRNKFLGETKKETQAKIDSGEYILTNLNN